jgi:hypothetical protein
VLVQAVQARRVAPFPAAREVLDGPLPIGQEEKHVFAPETAVRGLPDLSACPALSSKQIHAPVSAPKARTFAQVAVPLPRRRRRGEELRSRQPRESR